MCWANDLIKVNLPLIFTNSGRIEPSPFSRNSHVKHLHNVGNFEDMTPAMKGMPQLNSRTPNQKRPNFWCSKRLKPPESPESWLQVTCSFGPSPLSSCRASSTSSSAAPALRASCARARAPASPKASSVMAWRKANWAPGRLWGTKSIKKWYRKWMKMVQHLRHPQKYWKDFKDHPWSWSHGLSVGTIRYQLEQIHISENIPKASRGLRHNTPQQDSHKRNMLFRDNSFDLEHE